MNHNTVLEHHIFTFTIETYQSSVRFSLKSSPIGDDNGRTIALQQNAQITETRNQIYHTTSVVKEHLLTVVCFPPEFLFTPFSKGVVEA